MANPATAQSSVVELSSLSLPAARTSSEVPAVSEKLLSIRNFDSLSASLASDSLASGYGFPRGLNRGAAQPPRRAGDASIEVEKLLPGSDLNRR